MKKKNSKEILRCWKEIKKLKPTNEQLITLLKEFKELRDVIAQEFLNRRGTSREIAIVMKYSPEFRKELWPIFCETNPPVEDIKFVLNEIPALRKNAENLLKEREEKESKIWKIFYENLLGIPLLK